MAFTPNDLSFRQLITGAAPASSLVGFVVLINEDSVDPTFWDTVADGGGDIRASLDSDGNNQLPVEIVLCNVATKKLIAWARFSTYSIASRGLHFVALGEGQTQPSVTDTFGRNNVWQDYNAVLHLSEDVTTGVHADSTGNGHDTTLRQGASTARVAGNPIGGNFTELNGTQTLNLTSTAGILSGKSNVTLQVLKNSSQQAQNQGLFGCRDTGNIWIQLQTDSTSFSKYNNTNENLASSSGNVGNNVNAWVTSSQSNDSLKVYENGNLLGSDISISGTSFGANPDFTISGYFSYIESRNYQGRVAEVRIYDGEMPPDLIALEHSNQSAPATFWTQSTPDNPSGGGSTNYTLTLESGSYATSGQALKLLANRKLSIDSGSYQKNGTDLSLLHNKKIDLTSGNYSFVGSDIQLNYNQASSYSITLESGSYSTSGNNANLLHNKRLQLDSGGYETTGNDVALLHNKRIALESGNYEFIGSAINLEYAVSASYRITLESGNYEISGEELALRHNKRMSIEAGQYNSIGTNQNLLYNRKIQLESGEYEIIGTDIDVLYNRSITLESGSYQIDGSSINLVYSGFIELRIDGYTVSFKRSLVTASYARSLITTQYRHH